MSQVATFAFVYLVAAAIALAAAATICPRRKAPGGTPLALMLLAAAFWAVCDAVELYVPTIQGKQLVSQFQYIGVIAAAPFFFHAAMQLGGHGARLSPALFAAVWAVPLLSLLAAWTNSWHRWLWTNILPPSGDLPFAIYQYGWWFWVLTAQHYLLMVAATVVLLRAIRRVRGQFRIGMAAVLVAVVLPWIGNAAYNLKLGPWPGLNYLTLSLGVSGSILVWVVMREGLLDLLPRAREALIERMTDSVIVLGRDGGVMFANQAARDILPLDAPRLAGILGVGSLHDVPEHWSGEVQVEGRAARRWLDVRVDPIRDRWGEAAGRLLVARDVTVQKDFEDERERLIDELQGALRKVTELEGLLPICAHCRKVRDDSGYWEDVDEYFGSRTPVEFTHGICPDCAGTLYPSIMNG